MIEIFIAFLGGSALAALISQVGEYIRERKRYQERSDDEALKELAAIQEAVRYLLYDRIRSLGGKFLGDGTVDFDDRRILNNMHEVYHKKLKGNGDLDILIGEVNKLPLNSDKKGV